MSKLKIQLESLVDQTLDSILEASAWSQPGAHSIANPGAHSTTPTRKKDDTLADAVGGVEGQLQQAQAQIQQQGDLIGQIGQMASQDPENPLAGQIMGMLGEGMSLNENIIELDIPDVVDLVPQQGAAQHHEEHGEGKMANAQLQRATQDAMWLLDNVDSSQELESWVQAKITKAADYIQSVRNYLEYHKLGNDQLAEKKTKVSKTGQKRVSKKIGHLIGKEGKPEDQAAAIAYSMEKRGELKESAAINKESDEWVIPPDEDLRWGKGEWTGLKNYAIIDPEMIEDHEYLQNLKTTAGKYRETLKGWDDKTLARAFVGQGAGGTHQYGTAKKPFERYVGTTDPSLQGRQKLPFTWSLVAGEIERRQKEATAKTAAATTAANPPAMDKKEYYKALGMPTE